MKLIETFHRSLKMKIILLIVGLTIPLVLLFSLLLVQLDQATERQASIANAEAASVTLLHHAWHEFVHINKILKDVISLPSEEATAFTGQSRILRKSELEDLNLIFDELIESHHHLLDKGDSTLFIKGGSFTGSFVREITDLILEAQTNLKRLIQTSVDHPDLTASQYDFINKELKSLGDSLSVALKKVEQSLQAEELSFKQWLQYTWWKYMLLIVVVILMTMFTAWFFSKKLVIAPLFHLLGWLEQNSKGNTPQPFQTKKQDEIGYLSLKAVEIIQRLHQSMVSRTKLEAEIHARKEVEEALRKSEESAKNITTAAKDGIITLDKGLVTFWNPAAEEIFGYSAKEILGKDLHNYITPPELRDAAKKGFAHFLKTGQGPVLGKTLELDALKKDGKRITVELSVSSFSESGNLIAIGIVRDITARKELLEKLKFNEEMMRVSNSILQWGVLARSTEDFLTKVLGLLLSVERFQLEPRGGIFLADPKTETLKLVAEINLHPEIKKLCSSVEYGKCHCGTAAQTKTLQYSSCVDGRHVIHFEGMEDHGHYNIPIMAQNEVIAVLVLYLPKGYVKKEEEEANLLNLGDTIGSVLFQREKEAIATKLTEAVSQTSNLLVITDKDGVIEYVNPKFTEVTGYSSEEAIGQNPRVLKSGKQSRFFYEQLWKTIRAGNPWKGTFINKKKNGSLYYASAIISPIRNNIGEVTHYVGIQEDITEQLELEQNLRQAQKMDAVGKLAGGVAHDFNNQLSVIIGYCDFLLMDLDKKDGGYEGLLEIKKAAERSADLTKQLLTFSHKQIVTPKTICLNEVIENLNKMLERLLPKNVQIVMDLSPEKDFILADQGQLEQMLANLAVNARDAMPEGGTLTFSTSRIQGPPKALLELEENSIESGAWIVLNVTDTGVGIPADILEHVFDPFFTTKGKGRGTGLGLSTVYGIVKKAGGHIEVHSQLNKGTTFEISFPKVVPITEKAIEGESAAILPKAKGDETILLVEDEPGVRKMAVQILKNLGYQLLVAESGEAALKIVSSLTRPPDLLLTDVMMPGLSGTEVGEKISKIYPDIKILFMSGYSANLISQQSVSKASVKYLQKPFTAIQLASKVRTVLDEI